MAFLNLSFETLGATPGCPTGWVFGAHGQREYAFFTSFTQPWENFEASWNSNESYKFAFTGVPTDLTAANFTTAAILPKPYENFEEFWNSNEGYVLALAGIDAAFDTGTPENFEDFEEQWNTNESYKFFFVGVGTDLVAGMFESNAFENFEGSWTDPYVTTLTSPTSALFDSGANAFENFEGTWTAMTTI